MPTSWPLGLGAETVEGKKWRGLRWAIRDAERHVCQAGGFEKYVSSSSLFFVHPPLISVLTHHHSTFSILLALTARPILITCRMDHPKRPQKLPGPCHGEPGSEAVRDISEWDIYKWGMCAWGAGVLDRIDG